MARTTRSPLPAIHLYYINAEEKQTRQIRGQAPPKGIIMKAGMRVGEMSVGWSKSHRTRQWKKLAKRRASKRRRQEVLEA